MSDDLSLTIQRLNSLDGKRCEEQISNMPEDERLQFLSEVALVKATSATVRGDARSAATFFGIYLKTKKPAKPSKESK